MIKCFIQICFISSAGEMRENFYYNDQNKAGSDIEKIVEAMSETCLQSMAHDAPDEEIIYITPITGSVYLRPSIIKACCCTTEAEARAGKEMQKFFSEIYEEKVGF